MQRIKKINYIKDENDSLSEYSKISHLVTIVPMAPFTPKSTSKLRSALIAIKCIIYLYTTLQTKYAITVFFSLIIHAFSKVCTIVLQLLRNLPINPNVCFLIIASKL